MLIFENELRVGTLQLQFICLRSAYFDANADFFCIPARNIIAIKSKD